MGGYNSLPMQSGRNPYLDEIDAAAQNAHAQLSPGAQMALKKAGAPVGMTGGVPAGPQLIQGPRPTPPALAPMSENLPNGQPAMMAGTGITMPTRPSAAPAMPLAEGGIRGNAANNFNTSLAPGEEPQYQSWKAQYAPHDSGEDYDLRGAYKYGLTPDPKTGHWSDKFKKPNEPTFSVESQYAQDAPDRAGHWSGPNRDVYVPPAGASAAPAAITNPTRPQPQAVPPTAAAGPAEAHLASITAPPPADPNLVHTKQNTGTAGVNQIHNPWARVPLQILAGIGETFAPRLAAALPGTESHHQLLVGEAENAVKQQQGIREAEEKAQRNAADVGHLGAETEQLIPAQVEHLAAQAEALRNPQEKEGGAAHTITTDQGIMQWNPETKRYDIRAGGSPEKSPTGGSVHTLADGTMIIAHPDGSATPITINGQPAKAKVPETGESTDIKNYQFAKEQGYKGTFEQWQKDEANRKQPRPGVEPGTWTLQEGPDGKPLLFNSKTGATRPAPEGLNPRGTAAKDQPVKDALAYAENYMKRGKFTGPGDLALMDQFYQAAKPKRMNEKQNQLLLDSQSLIESAKQGIERKFSPNAPYFDDTQRQNIVDTMRDLAASQGAHAGQQPPGGGATGGVPNVGDMFQGGKVLKVTKIK